jgi:hypothetical protein
MKKLTFKNISTVLSRAEMKEIMAGSSFGSYYLTCNNCQNDTCRGYVDDCSIQSIWPMCGSHDTGWTCTCI